MALEVDNLRVHRPKVAALLGTRALMEVALRVEIVLAIVTRAAVVELGVYQMQITIRWSKSTRTRHFVSSVSSRLLVALLESC
jgi:hypothetical protein